jgi:hypothetical protein
MTPIATYGELAMIDDALYRSLGFSTYLSYDITTSEAVYL